MLPCLDSAAQSWNVPRAAIVAVYRAAQKDRSGGIGPMRIPAQWLPKLETVGFSAAKVRTNACTNVQAAAAILAANHSAHQTDAASTHSPLPAPTCLAKAAFTYGVSLSMAETYYHRASSHRTAATVGVMDIPRSWLPILREAGFPVWRVTHKTCWNIGAGVWILSALEKNHTVTGGVTAALHGGSIPHLPSAYLPIIQQAAAQYGVPTALIEAVMAQESGFDARAVSPAGADGLMQLMPATAARYGVSDAFNPRQAILGGTAYLAHLLRVFDGQVQLALAGYNAGGNAVKHWGYRIPPYQQTQHYVPAVLRRYKAFTAE